MIVADYIAQFLTDRGVPFVFEMSGGMITRMLDAIYRNGSPQIISVHHEQAAAFAADAVGRMTGVPGVAMATSGPGATNLLTGIGSCFFDSAPAVFITGQVNRHEMKGSSGVRQLGFQETDIVSMATPITKAAWTATDPEEVPRLLEAAFALAMESRPGPVLLDIPMDVQGSELDKNPAMSTAPEVPRTQPDEKIWTDLLDAFEKAERPLMLLGGGVAASGSVDLARSFVRALGVPSVVSLLGLDVLPYNDPLRVGMIGSYGNRWANLAIGEADCLLVLGSRLDVRQTGSEVEAFAENKNIFHVDCDPAEINNRVKGCVGIVAHLHDFLREGCIRVQARSWPDRSAWLQWISDKRDKWPDTSESTTAGINPNMLMHEISRFSTRAAAYVLDVGQHQMWAGQSLEVEPHQRILTSGGMGSMGYALPAAIGAALSVYSEPVVVIAGDGGFQSNIQELQTVIRNQLPMKIVIVNNNCHGMVRQFQESYFNGRYQSTVWGYSSPDFEAVGKAYGLDSRSVDDEDELHDALAWLWKEPTKPALLQVAIDPSANVYPKIAFGHPITEMEPFATPLEMEGT